MKEQIENLIEKYEAVEIETRLSIDPFDYGCTHDKAVCDTLIEVITDLKQLLNQ